MQPHERRVMDEKEELDVKIEKLDTFTRTQAFAGLAQEERINLREQLYFMERYSAILNRRITAFKES